MIKAQICVWYDKQDKKLFQKIKAINGVKSVGNFKDLISNEDIIVANVIVEDMDNIRRVLSEIAEIYGVIKVFAIRKFKKSK